MSSTNDGVQHRAVRSVRCSQLLTRNIVTDPLPDGELCLIRQALQHLSNADIQAISEKCTKYPRLIVTEHHPDPLVGEPNLDKQPGCGVSVLLGAVLPG